MPYLDRALLDAETITYAPLFSRFAAYGAPLVEFAGVAIAWSAARFIALDLLLPDGVVTPAALGWLYLGGLALMATRFGWRMAVRFLNLAFSELAVTDGRFLEKTGVLDVAFWAVELDKIQRVEIAQPLLGRFFNYGDVTIVTVGEVNHTTPAVAAPIRLQQALHARMTRPEPIPAAFSAPSPRLTDERVAP
jgi:hypothetical protein